MFGIADWPRGQWLGSREEIASPNSHPSAKNAKSHKSLRRIKLQQKRKNEAGFSKRHLCQSRTIIFSSCINQRFDFPLCLLVTVDPGFQPRRVLPGAGKANRIRREYFSFQRFEESEAPARDGVETTNRGEGTPHPALKWNNTRAAR